MEEKYKNPMWISSPYNFMKDVNFNMEFPSNVEILDLTLDEDGEGMSGAHLSLESKIHIARMLDEIGVNRIGVLGFPSALSKDENDRLKDEIEVVKEISKTVHNSKLWTLATTKEDIDRALECKVTGVIVRKFVTDFNDIQPELLTKKISDLTDLCEYAKKGGVRVGVMAQDATRANPKEGVLRRMISSVHEKVGLDELCLTDSFGIATPFGMALLVKETLGWIDIPLQVHCHNHLGLGVANACAAVAAGAQVVHTTVNGMGHFAGLTAMEEFCVAIRIGFGIDTNIKYSNLTQLSKLVKKSTGVDVAPHKAIVGDRAFALSEDIAKVQELIDREKVRKPEREYLPFAPEFVGQSVKFVMAQKVSRLAIEQNLSENGLMASEKQMEEIITIVKYMATASNNVINNELFISIAKIVGCSKIRSR